VAEREELTPLQRELLDYITNMAEPTWIMLKEIPATNGDRGLVESQLRDLEERGLVTHTREVSGGPGPT
jgi:DNA-binding MarR family transcriptional regulator